MLESLSLRDFQIHQRFDLELDRHVTVLVGESDRGKSSVVRALRWLALNQPAGCAFVRHGSKQARVKAIVDGRSIVRSKGKGTNSYRLDGKAFKAFGTQPEEVAGMLNVSELNFQTQFEPHFWLSLPAGQVSRELNRIINLGAIDSALSNASAGVRGVRAEIEVTEKRLAETDRISQSLQWTKEADAQLRAIEEGQADIDGFRARAESLKILLGGLQSASGRANMAIPDASRLSELAEALKDARERARILKGGLNQIEWAQLDLGTKQAALEEASRKLKELDDGRCPLCGRGG